MLGTTFLLALRSIARHKLRSILTALGIIIGVAAVVSMVTLGKATTAAVQQSIASLGTNILQVRPGQGFGRGGGGPRPPDFKPEDVQAIAKQIAGVTAVAAQAQASATAIYEGANWSTTINGTTNGYFDVQPWPLTEGRAFTPIEEAAGKSVCIIGNTVSKNLYHGGQAVGTRMRIGAISCDVIGVLSTRGQSGFGGDQDDVVIMPIKAVQRRFTGNRDIRLILVGVDKAFASSTVQASIENLLRERRNITAGKDDDFFVFDTKQINDTLTGATTALTGIVTAVAAISLIVGGDRHHEHHARLGDRADARDRHPTRDWRGGERGLAAIPGRGDRTVDAWRAARAGAGASGRPGADPGAQGDVSVRSADQFDRLCDFRVDRRGVRLFPGAPRRRTQPDRRAAPRMIRR